MLRHLITKRAAVESQLLRSCQMSLRMCSRNQTMLLSESVLSSRRHFSSFLNKDSDNQDNFDSKQKNMDSFASKPSREGAKSHMKTILQKKNLQDKQEKSINDQKKPNRLSWMKDSTSSQKKIQSSQSFKDQSGETNRDRGDAQASIVQDAYIQKFGVIKPELLKQWLAMENEDLLKESQQLGLKMVAQKASGDPAHYTTAQLMQLLFSHLSKFEAEVITTAKQEARPVAQSNDQASSRPSTKLEKGRSIETTFGRSRKDQTDKWLAMDSKELIQECHKFGLTPSEAKDANIKILFKFMDSVLAGEDDAKLNEGDNSSDQFFKKNIMTRQVDAASEQVKITLSKLQDKYLKNKERAETLLEQQSEKDDLLNEDFMMMSDPQERNRNNLVDVPMGPMRPQKAAPKFDIMTYLSNESSSKTFDVSRNQREQTKMKVKSAFDGPEKNEFAVRNFEEIFDFRQERVVGNEINAEELLKHESLKSFNFDMTGINTFDKQLITSTLEQIKLARVNQSPNLTFQELTKQIARQGEIGFDKASQAQAYIDMLYFANQRLALLNPENRRQIDAYLHQIDKMISDNSADKIEDLNILGQIVELGLQTQTHMPSLISLCKDPKFLIQEFQQGYDPDVDKVAKIVSSLIKMVKQDFAKLRTSQTEFESNIQMIQNKVEQIQAVIMSEAGQKSQVIITSISQKKPYELLNRIILFPTPTDGSRLQKLLGKSLRALISADVRTENGFQGLFNPCERNYILARGMQVLDNKELQNEMRTIGSSETGSGMQYVAQEAMHSSYILAGKIKEDTELNNIHYLAGILPPTVRADTHTIKLKDSFSRIDKSHIRRIQLALRKQLFGFNTLKDLQNMLAFMEFTEKHSPMSVWKQGSDVNQFLQNLAIQSKRFQFKLNDLIRLQNIFLVSLQTPTFLFDDILAHKDSLATVEKPVLQYFIGDMLARMMQHVVIFDHLQNSTSSIHRSFLPCNKETYRVLSKIIMDLVAEGDSSIPNENFALINNILSLEQVTSKVFDSSDRAVSVLGKFLGQQLQNLEAKSKKSTADKTGQLDTLQSQIDHLHTYDAIFKALRAVKPLVASEPQLVNIIETSVDVALQNLMKDLNTFTVNESEKWIGKKTFKKDDFPLDELIQTNKSILDAIASLDEPKRKQLMTTYLHSTPIPEIIDLTLKPHLKQDFTALEKREFIFSSPKSNRLIKQAIEKQTWGKIERLSGPLVTYFNQVLDSEVLDPHHKKEFMELAESFLLKIKNSRSLHGVELARFFKLIKQLQVEKGQDANKFDKLIMNVSCNLRTLAVNLLFQFEEDSNEVSIGKDSLFKGENEERFEKDRQYKQMIFQMYKDVFSRDPQLFSQHQGYGLSPLGVIFAELFDDMSFDERKNCLSMLGDYSIDNYTEEFIEKLYEHFSHQHQIKELLQEDVKKFVDLSDKWPKFLQNNVLLTELSTIDASNFSIEDQSRILMIQTHKNILNPHFIQNHFSQFIRSTDKDQVRSCIANFLQSIAYVGCADDIDMEQVTQVLRRIYKEPKMVDTQQLLNFLVTMAVSNARYNDFDLKSKQFVEQALDVIEKQFTGTKQITAYRGSGDDQKTFQLFLFNQIPSTKKSYNKILDKNTLSFESNLMRDGRKEYFQQADKALTGKFRGTLDGEDIIQDDLMVPISLIPDEEEVQEAGPEGLNIKHVYDRGATDAGSSFDESHYFKMRTQKLAQLAKRDNHLLLYSNVNTLDFVDINTMDVAKAWTILFHFRGKSIESMLFEEFNSIAQRNTISKTKNHEMFNKMYLELNSECYINNLQLEMAGSCERTGWPIDIALSDFFLRKTSPKDTSAADENGAEALKEDNPKQQYAVYFLLQEEICYNSKTRKEEPLGLQKLMLRHLSQISNYRVCTVDENEAANNIDSVIAKIQDEFYPVLSTPRSVQKKQQQPNPEPADESKPFDLQNQDDFHSEAEDDIVGRPQSML